MALPGQKATKVKPDRTEPMGQKEIKVMLVDKASKVIPELKVTSELQELKVKLVDKASKVKKA
jgi:hypothetical protein